MDSKDDKLVCHHCKQEIEEVEYNIFTQMAKYIMAVISQKSIEELIEVITIISIVTKDNIFLKDNNTFEIIKSKELLV